MPADMSKVPSDVESGPLAPAKVAAGLAEVRQRLEKACNEHKVLYQRYQAIPEEARADGRITHDHREELHSEFASSPGMYDGILGVIGESVAEAAAELRGGNVEDCFESLRGAMEFLAPIEKKLADYETAMKAHEQTTKQIDEEKAKQQQPEQPEHEQEQQQDTETTDKTKKTKKRGKKEDTPMKH